MGPVGPAAVTLSVVQRMQFAAVIGAVAAGSGQAGQTGQAGQAREAVVLAIGAGLFPATPTMVLSGFMGWVGDQRPHAVKQMQTNLALKVHTYWVHTYCAVLWCVHCAAVLLLGRCRAVRCWGGGVLCTMCSVQCAAAELLSVRCCAVLWCVVRCAVP